MRRKRPQVEGEDDIRERTNREQRERERLNIEKQNERHLGGVIWGGMCGALGGRNMRGIRREKEGGREEEGV